MNRPMYNQSLNQSMSSQNMSNSSMNVRPVLSNYLNDKTQLTTRRQPPSNMVRLWTRLSEKISLDDFSQSWNYDFKQFLTLKLSSHSGQIRCRVSTVRHLIAKIPPCREWINRCPSTWITWTECLQIRHPCTQILIISKMSLWWIEWIIATEWQATRYKLPNFFNKNSLVWISELYKIILNLSKICRPVWTIWIEIWPWWIKLIVWIQCTRNR